MAAETRLAIDERHPLIRTLFVVLFLVLFPVCCVAALVGLVLSLIAGEGGQAIYFGVLAVLIGVPSVFGIRNAGAMLRPSAKAFVVNSAGLRVDVDGRPPTPTVTWSDVRSVRVSGGRVKVVAVAPPNEDVRVARGVRKGDPVALYSFPLRAVEGGRDALAAGIASASGGRVKLQS